MADKAKEHKYRHEVMKGPSERFDKMLPKYFWHASTGVLLLLLIISIFTGGFGFGNPTVARLISDANDLKSSTADASLKNALETAVNSLQPYANVKSDYSGKQVVIVEYSDFQCPYCKKANDDAVAKITKNFGDAVVFEYKHFPLSFHPYAEKAAEASECARDQNKFWEYHDKLFQNQQSLDTDSLKKYAKDIGLDTGKFNQCLDSGQKAAAVQADFSEGQQRGVSGTPAFFVGTTLISGAQPYESFLPVICKEIPEHEACKNAPKPVNFKMYVIDDKRCVDCDSTQLTNVLKTNYFTGVEVVNLDYNSAKGKELYDLAGVVYLPMYILEKSAKDDPGFSKIDPAVFVQKGDYYVIQPQAVRATFDPKAEICNNGVDDNADGIVDCKDTKCAQSLVCRAEKKNTVDLFIMSDCPYGKEAVKALKEAKDNFGASLNFGVHYIANDNGDGTFQSLHGSYEAEEDIRQLCAKEIAPAKYFDYVYCRSVNGINGVDWQACAKTAGIDTAALKACSEGENGISLMKEDIKIAQALGISASPTWLANNRYEFSGIDAETVRQNFCQYNQGASGCENTLSQDTAIPAGGCG